MKIFDLNRLGEVSRIDADLCIVGTGPAGLSVAHALAGANIRVLVLESGGFDDEPATQALYDIEASPPRIVSQDLLRTRILGGSSHVWTGRCAPFQECDFEKRSWIPYSGWPISLSDLEPYFSPASEMLGLAPYPYDESLWPRLRIARPLPALEAAPAADSMWTSSRTLASRLCGAGSRVFRYPPVAAMAASHSSRVFRGGAYMAYRSTGNRSAKDRRARCFPAPNSLSGDLGDFLEDLGEGLVRRCRRLARGCRWSRSSTGASRSAIFSLDMEGRAVPFAPLPLRGFMLRSAVPVVALRRPVMFRNLFAWLCATTKRSRAPLFPSSRFAGRTAGRHRAAIGGRPLENRNYPRDGRAGRSGYLRNRR